MMKAKKGKRMAGIVAAAALLMATPFTVSAAESKTVQEKAVTLEFNGYISDEGGKTFKGVAEPKGINLEEYHFEKYNEYAQEWLLDGRSEITKPGFSLTFDKFFTVGENSVANISKNPAYGDKSLELHPSCYWLDENDDIAYLVEYASITTKIESDPIRFFIFDNVNPTQPVIGNHFFESQYPGVLPVEKLLYVLEVQENGSPVATYGFRVGEGAPASGYDNTGFTFATGNIAEIPVNGKVTAFEAYMINDNNYMKLRDVAMALNGTGSQFNVVWDGQKKAIDLLTSTAYSATGTELPVQKMLDEQQSSGTVSMGVPVQSYAPKSKNAAANSAKIYLNGNELNITAYSIEGNTYFKLRDLGEALGFTVGWNNEQKMATITTK